MLHPDTTVLLTDALRPPAGYRVDQAVTTTYTLNLTAMLIAPMTFTLGDIDGADDLATSDPVRLLDAVQRHVEHTTVFVQAGGIHVPATHSRIHAFLEDSIHEVMPTHAEHLFHPKLSVVRFSADDGSFHHRVVVSSRNLTLDNSWDTVLVLDEDKHGTIAAGPAADVVAALPSLTLDPLPEGRAAAVADLARTLRDVNLAAPVPFTGGSLLPLGLTEERPWPFPQTPERVLAISPFLSAATLDSIRAGSAEATLVSRPEAMDLLGRRRLAGWSTTVLHRGVEESEDDQAGVRTLDEFTAVVSASGQPEEQDRQDGADHPGIGTVVRLDGLHAKTVVLDLPGDQSMVVTGSANLTGQAWSGGLEMNAVLTGPTATCGVHAVLGAGRESLGLGAILQPYTPQYDDGATDPAIATSYQLEEFHRALARQRPELVVTEVEEDRVEARLSLTIPDDAPGATRIWLTTVPAQDRELAARQRWEIAPVNVTPFLAVETTAGEGEARVTRRCVLMMRIHGDPLGRRRAVLAAILSNSRSVLRYLALLLGMDPLQSGPSAWENVAETTARLDDAGSDGAAGYALPLVLFEPLVRAAGQDPKALASVARQVAELREMPGAEDVIPPEFLQMWDVVLRVVQKGRKP
ncbi:hypothetical protein [Citricoccus alkalitolerans]|uniref:PLD phosphodiesterase domain-containing protein n=1 Tax=Citricoccus alkalitolerans TaxID=246603 RepID=A0ABV8XVX6_9MICC